MKCPGCNTINQNDSSFCIECGVSLEALQKNDSYSLRETLFDMKKNRESLLDTNKESQNVSFLKEMLKTSLQKETKRSLNKKIENIDETIRENEHNNKNIIVKEGEFNATLDKTPYQDNYNSLDIKKLKEKWYYQLADANFPVPIFPRQVERSNFTQQRSYIAIFNRMKQALIEDRTEIQHVINYIPAIFFNIQYDEVKAWNTRARANMLIRYLEDEYNGILDVAYPTQPMVPPQLIINVFVQSLMPANSIPTNPKSVIYRDA